ncbi:MAG TPA: CBS domain-containing protein [Gemmatimonadaceae bacterium]|nr:CBS domain-containing protein [Gemmatimonadaceae bacterium]
MSPRTISDDALHHPPALHADDLLGDALATLLDSDLPALPVVDERERYVGIFGEREFMAAVFPGYLGQLRGAGFLSHSIDAALERREACRVEPVRQHMTTEHIDVGPDYSDTQLAEIFLHHRVLIVPIVDDGRVVGIVTRHDFFTAVGRRFLAKA